MRLRILSAVNKFLIRIDRGNACLRFKFLSMASTRSNTPYKVIFEYSETCGSRRRSVWSPVPPSSSTLGAGEENERQSGRTDPPIAAPDNHD